MQRAPKPGDDATADYPKLKHWNSADDMIKDPAVELVVVTSSPDAHYEQTKKALDAGKHVLCEKPLVATAAHALELNEISKKNGKILTVYQNRRWDSDFLTLRKLLDDGKLGRLVDFDTRFDRWRVEPPTAAAATWKFKQGVASGAIYDLGVHLIDQLVVLFGMPERVTAFMMNHRQYTEKGTGGETGGDSFICHLHYDSRGLTATARTSVASLHKGQMRYWVRGDKGTYIKYNTDTQEDQLKGPKGGVEKLSDPKFGVDPTAGVLTTLNSDGKLVKTNVFADDPPATYIAFYKLLHAALGGRGENPVTAEQAAKVLKIIELAKQSSAEGRTIKVEM